jgi:hypothetical protein
VILTLDGNTSRCGINGSIVHVYSIYDINVIYCNISVYHHGYYLFHVARVEGSGLLIIKGWSLSMDIIQ